MAGVPGVAEIRAFAEADRAGLRGLSGRAGEGAPPGPLWGHEESEAAVYVRSVIRTPDRLVSEVGAIARR